MGSIVLLDLMGGVALLLWGLHMVHSGILRAFGPDLRRLLSKALGNRFAAFAAGLGLTALLQSSTATGLMTASFAAAGLVGLVPALAIMLGANVGTTLIVQILAFNVTAVAPVLFIIGLIAFRSGARTRVKDLGRAAIGLGLTLLALHILLDTLAPAENAPGVRTLLNAITDDPVLCIVLAGALTWAAHSSVATVLLIMGTNLLVLLVFVTIGLGVGGERPAALGPVVAVAWVGLGIYVAVVTVKPRWLASRPLFDVLLSAGVGGHLKAMVVRVPHIAALMLFNLVAMRGFGIEIPAGAALAGLPVVMFIAVLPISVQGLGTTQAAWVLFFARYVPAGGSSPQAVILAASLAAQAIALSFQITTGFICLRSKVARGLGDAAKQGLADAAP